MRRCFIRVVEWVDLQRLDEGWAAFLGCVSEYVDIVEGNDPDLRGRGKMKILAFFIEKWTRDVVPMYMNKGELHDWMQLKIQRIL